MASRVSIWRLSGTAAVRNHQNIRRPRRREQLRTHGVVTDMQRLSIESGILAPLPRGSVLSTLAALSALTAVIAAPCGAQSAPAQRPADCPPGVSRNAPVLGRDDPDQTLSEELANSNGIVCPPAGIDSEMRLKPPQGGEIEIIRPPGTPGGNQRIQPK